MGLAKAFDAISRTQLWTTLYKKGIPVENITQIRQGRLKTTLCGKHRGRYGEEQQNNVGVFQGSAISALMFIIYIDDMMEDYNAINHKHQLPTRKTIQRKSTTGEDELLKKYTKKRKNDNKQTKRKMGKHGGEIGKTRKRQTTTGKTYRKIKTHVAEVIYKKEERVLYAGDTNLLIAKETTQQTTQKLTNYEKLTQSGQLSIQWGKVKNNHAGKWRKSPRRPSIPVQ